MCFAFRHGAQNNEGGKSFLVTMEDTPHGCRKTMFETIFSYTELPFLLHLAVPNNLYMSKWWFALSLKKEILFALIFSYLSDILLLISLRFVGALQHLLPK